MAQMLSNQFQKIINSFSIVDSSNCKNIIDFYLSDLKISSMYTFNISYVSNVITFQDYSNNLQFLMPFFKENNLKLTNYEDKYKLLTYLTSFNSKPYRLTDIIAELETCKNHLETILQQFSSVYSSSQYKGLFYLTDYIVNRTGAYELNKCDFKLHGFTPETKYHEILVDSMGTYDGVYIYSLVNENQVTETYTYYAMYINSDLTISSPTRINLKCKVPQFMHIINSNNVRFRNDLATHYNNYIVKCNELISSINSILALT